MRTKIMIATFCIPLGLMFILPLEKEDKARQNALLNEEEPLSEELLSFVKVRDMIRERYVEEVDSRDLIFSAMQGMFSSLEHARFYIPEEETRFQEEISGLYIGLGLYCEKADHKLLVKNTLYDSPAQEKLKRGDEILEIDGAATQGLTLADAYTLMRGSEEPGTPCDLKVRRKNGGAVELCRLVRGRVTRPSVSSGWWVDTDRAIGYIAIERFLKHTHREFEAVLESLAEKKIRSLILDLRFNTGGVLEAAVAVANLFIPEGVLVSTRGRYPAAEQVYTAMRSQFRYPEMNLVLLINQESASATEVLAGALQDYKRAVIMGEHSFGKGVVQSAVTMELLGRPVTLKLPVALYFLPSGRCIEKKLGMRHAGQGGLEPDITVTVSKQQFRALKTAFNNISLLDERQKELSDPQLDAAIRFLKGEKVFTPFTDPTENEKTIDGRKEES
ncbi:MAG: S41 family peptidase [Planctomycetota bacterium]